ncbi:hypothetical protein LTR17_024327 [Elasticomyces elasticus]|nr:hypothetical protein LTR17_024327 [Elasticomyces elasticus]
MVTKLDICIGLLLIVHDSARQELSEQEWVFLQGMAKRGMEQLEITWEVEAQRRGSMMSEGIDSFIQHREGVTPNPPEESSSNQVKRVSTEVTSGATPQPASASRLVNIPHDSSQAHKDLKGNSKQLSQSAQQEKKGHDSDDTIHGETTYRKTFRRAAACLRTSLEVDGVMFVDGFIEWHAEMLPVAEPELELEREMTQIAKAEQTKDIPTNGETPNEEPCGFTSADYRKDIYAARRAEILGYSFQYGRPTPPTRQLTESTKSMAYMTEGFLQNFLERHPEGRTWYFDEARNPFRFDGDALVPGEDQFGDADNIALSFPNARQVIFSPLTDPVLRKHLAGSFAWTSEVLPVFTDRTVLCSYKAFLHSVVAEISRLDTVAAVKQQTSFVSSVSHELRSPLHGILGAAELLAETDLDDFQRGLMDTIRACGSTLQDTLSNVLSYAKINDFEQKRNRPAQNRPRDSPWALENKAQKAVQQSGSSAGLFVSTNVAYICEDIVHVLEIGRLYNTSSSDKAPTVTLDIRYHESWIFMTEPGALRRIMMNIIGNAVKYSPEGVVNVSLEAWDAEKTESQGEAQPRWCDEDETKKKLVAFTVKDTGKGMSKDFLENQLFLPFHQEDTVKSEGVGLGMSIVKSLVNLLAGKIEVTSRPGKGSEFKISIPMSAPKITQYVPSAPPIEQDIAVLRARNLTVAIHGLERAVAQSIRGYLVNWFSCVVVAFEGEGPHPDMILADGADDDNLEELQTRLGAYHQRLAVLTVTNGPPKPASSMYSVGEHIWERISRPLGPHKLAKVLGRCVESLQDLNQSHMKANAKEKQHKALSTKGSHSMLAIATPHSAVAVSQPHEHSSVMRDRDTSDSVSPAHSRTGTIGSSPSDISQSNCAAMPLVSQGPSILLVEDNTINLKLLETFLAKRGYTNVESAADGLQAVQATERRAEGFDIVITDISMPVMDGFETSRKIRELEQRRLISSPPSLTSYKSALLVALTGLASVDDQDEALWNGVDVFLTKPVRLAELGELLGRWERGEISGRGATEAGSMI